MRYVIGGVSSVDAAQLIVIEPGDRLEPVGNPGMVGGAVSATALSPGARSRTTWSKFAVNVVAAASPIWMRPTPVVPVLACHAFTIFTPSRYRSHVVDVPTVPHSSMLCQPVPSTTWEFITLAANSERIRSRLVPLRATLMILPPEPVSMRRTSNVEPDARFTFVLKHTWLYEVP